MSRNLLLPLVAVLLAGCASDATGPTAPTGFTATDLTPRTKVDRFEVAIASVTWDLDRGLMIATGWPAPSPEWNLCGGTQIVIPEFMSIKENGQRRGVLHWNGVDQDASVRIYQLPSDWDEDWLALLCETTPFAVGTGRIRVTDNDVTNTLERVRTTTYTVQGFVTVVATGEVLRVTATDNTKFHPDGSLVAKANILLR